MKNNQFIKYMKKNNYLNILLSLYLLFSISTYSIWQAKNHNNITGDEPHYLVMANGISKYQSFEQTKPYQEEFITREIYPPGLNTEMRIPVHRHKILMQYWVPTVYLMFIILGFHYY